MKKNVLALSITAALIGLTGGAHAMSSFGELKGASADSMVLSTTGIGHMLVVPYFTTQKNNSTMINIVNTDTIGKVLKIRFRGAANSDDLYDFQVFMSPKDVWTASLAKGADGRTQLTTKDNTCTKPARAVLNSTAFITARLDQTMSVEGKANGTREGYVEIFNMADIAAGSPLALAITHGTTNGLPPGCGLPGTGAVSSAWTDLDASNVTPPLTNALATSKYLKPPTSGLMANWTIIDVVNAATWAGEAVAFEAVNSLAAAGDRATGNLVYWPQIPETLKLSEITGGFTSDTIMPHAPTDTEGYNTDGWASLDLPDMSIPYVRIAGTTTPVSTGAFANMLAKAVASTSATGEFYNDVETLASTDWVFSMPSRRYMAAFDYRNDRIRTNPNNYFATGTGGNLTSKTNAQSFGNGRMICLTNNITAAPVDREERIPPIAGGVGVVISPADPAQPPTAFQICGEVGVLSVNVTAGPAAGLSSMALGSSVSWLDMSTALITGPDAVKYGWIKIATPGVKNLVPGTTTGATYDSGLPLLGGSFVRAALVNPADAKLNKGFGATYGHRFVRPLY